MNIQLTFIAPLFGALAIHTSAAVLAPGTPIVLANQEPAPVQRAVKNLQRDLKKVFGVESPAVRNVSAISGRPAILVAGPSSPITKARAGAMVFAAVVSMGKSRGTVPAATRTAL